MCLVLVSRRMKEGTLTKEMDAGWAGVEVKTSELGGMKGGSAVGSSAEIFKSKALCESVSSCMAPSGLA